jgi:hypothetical protein
MIIDHANFRNFFINKNLSRKKVKWWKRLAKLDFKIEYRSDKSNLVDDSSRRRNYENQTAKKNKLRNENLNLRKWALIENNAFFKNKNEKNKKKIFHFIVSKSIRRFDECKQQFIKTQKTIDETLKSNYLQNKNQSSTHALNSTAKNFQKRMKIVTIVKKILKNKIFQFIVSNDRRDIETTSTRKRRE